MKLLGQALLAFSFVLALGAGVARAQTKINSCGTITESGPYVLSKDITASATDLITAGPGFVCIVIAADFVTLDLAGYTISGPGVGSVSTFGIANDISRQGTVVRSGTVTNFGTFGIFLQGSGMTVEHIRAMNNGSTGIAVEGGRGHRIVGNILVGNLVFGIVVTCPAVVLENVASGNGFDTIQASGAGCTLAENSPAP
jgi:hypothetical protein